MRPLLMLMSLSLLLVTGKMELRWGLLSVFPRPMPVRHDARLFPRLFTTNKSLDIPYLPMDSEIAPIGENRSFILEGSLCFEILTDSYTSSPCIGLANRTTGWFNIFQSDGSHSISSDTEGLQVITGYRVNATWLTGSLPVKHFNASSVPPMQPKWSPFCKSVFEGNSWPWTGCQSRAVQWVGRQHLFTFSPGLDGNSPPSVGTVKQNFLANPFDNWLLCGLNGSCLQAEALAMIAGGSQGIRLFHCKYTASIVLSTSSGKKDSELTCQGQRSSYDQEQNYDPTPVCLYPPFVFIVSNQNPSFCTNATCFYAQCWNASKHSFALVTRMPRWVPVPVKAPDALIQYRIKRDFGITAAIITAISLAAAGAATAAIAMSHTVQTAQTLNNLSANVAQALDVQKDLSAQLKGGLMVVNQRIDLVQEQIDVIWQLAQLGCEWKFPGLCVTSIQYKNFTRAANLSKQLSSYLLGNWTGEFENIMEQLRVAIVTVNSTRVNAELVEGLASWLSTAMDHLKEWAGIGALAGLMVLILLVCLWCMYRLRSRRRRDAAMIAQAFSAIEAGQSPCVWLAALNE